MSFNWASYIQLADELIKHEGASSIQEAYLRSAVSRSYYGVFCIARNLLTAKGTSIPPVDTHKFVKNEYKKSKIKTEQKISENLQRLHRERKNADYENDTTFDANRAITAHELSNRILKNLNTLP